VMRERVARSARSRSWIMRSRITSTSSPRFTGGREPMCLDELGRAQVRQGRRHRRIVPLDMAHVEHLARPRAPR
jgi:hypothetical protein